MAWADAIAAQEPLLAEPLTDNVSTALADAVADVAPSPFIITAESFAPTDAVNHTYNYLAGISDSCVPTDELSALFVYLAALEDSGVPLDDVIYSFIIKLSYTLADTNGTNFDDAVAFKAPIPYTLSDNASTALQDAIAGLFTYRATLTEGGLTADEVVALFKYLAKLTDSETPTDDITYLPWTWKLNYFRNRKKHS